ncbi:MAG: hypothetical protein GXX91_16140, partial [Verrucomicrobiaceae bacterium]|nr:hypothetical protein [Verrucomicrobiaceae bacterium]
IMGAAVWGLAGWGESILFAEGRFFQRLGAMGGLVAFGLLIYLIAIVGTRVYSVADLKRKFRRNRT